MGIYYNKSKGRWILEEQIGGKRKQIGSFKTRREAEKAKSNLKATVDSYKNEYIQDGQKPQVELSWVGKAIDKVSGLLKKRK